MDTPPTGSLIGWIQAMIGGGATTLLVASLGRLVWHGQEVRAGRRPVIGPHLLYEAPTAVLMAIGAEALGAWLDLPATVTTGVVAVASYLGPRGVWDVVWRILPSRKP